jgi:hypothetical protein
VQDGRIHVEKINGPFLFREKGAPAEYKAGLDLAIDRGWLWLHDSGTYVKFTQAGADLFGSSRSKLFASASQCSTRKLTFDARKGLGFDPTIDVP